MQTRARQPGPGCVLGKHKRPAAGRAEDRAKSRATHDMSLNLGARLRSKLYSWQSRNLLVSSETATTGSKTRAMTYHNLMFGMLGRRRQ